MSKIDNLSWRFFLAIEKQLIDSHRYIEPVKANYNTFSIHYRSIILQACSEFENICKKICDMQPDDRKNINDYLHFIWKYHQRFFEIEISIPLYNEKLMLFIEGEKLLEGGKLPFWQAYNEIKHQGKIEQATFKNAIDSVAALFAILLAWYKKSCGSDFSAAENMELPKLFDYPGLQPRNLLMESSYNVEVPGFEAVKEECAQVV